MRMAVKLSIARSLSGPSAMAFIGMIMLRVKQEGRGSPRTGSEGERVASPLRQKSHDMDVQFDRPYSSVKLSGGLIKNRGLIELGKSLPFPVSV